MKSLTKKLFAMSLAIVMALSAVACSAPEEETTQAPASEASTESEAPAEAPPPDNEDMNIEFWNLGTTGVDKVIYESMTAIANELVPEGYTVTMVPTVNDQYKEKIVLAMSSGECPDIYTSWSGGPMIEYIESGFAFPVTELVEANPVGEMAMDAALAQGTYNGEIYGVPFINTSIVGVFYNKAMFEEYGVTIPTTVSELEAAADTFVANGIIPFALANQPQWTGSMYFMSLATRFAGLDPFNAAVSGEGSFEHESYVYAGEKIQEWVNNGYFPEGMNSMSPDDGQDRALLYQEAAAMMVHGSWNTGSLRNDSEEFYQNIGWFPFPAVDGSDADASIQIGTIGDQFLHFYCEGEKQEAAFEVINGFYTEENIQFVAEQGYNPPVNNILDYVTDPVAIQIMEAALSASNVQLWYDQYLPPAVADVHKSTSQQIFGLEITPEEANAALQAEMEAYLAG